MGARINGFDLTFVAVVTFVRSSINYVENWNLSMYG